MRLFRFAIVFAAGALLGGAALAQPPGGGGGFGGGGFGGFGGGFGGRGLTMVLGFNKQLQDELKMDKEQVDKLNEAMTKVREEMRDLFTKLRDAMPEERTEMVKKMTESNENAVNSVLKPEQMKRLHQIENQQAGIGMYLKEDVQKSLKLTDEQKTKIATINSDLQKDLRELRGGGGFGGGFDPQTQRKRQSLTKEAMENVAGVLNDEQKTQVKSLLGEPFEMQQGGFGFGGGGGGGGRGGPGGGFGGFGTPAQPGQVMSTAIQDRLKLTEDQKKQMQELQKDVDAKLEKILTEEQRKQLKEMGPGPGRGRRGGRGGAGSDRP